MKILAVDPGKTTGYVLADVDGTETIVCRSWGEAPQLEFCQWAYDMVGILGIELIVCESWEPRAAGVRTWQPEPIEVIGMLRWLAKRSRIGFRLQTARDAKRFATTAKLAPYGQVRSANGHARDAMRHLVLASWSGVVSTR